MNTVELQSEEQVLAVVRRSICRDLPRFFFAGILVLIPFFFFFPLIKLGLFGFLLFLAILGISALYMLRVWVMWFYSVLIVTDEHVIDSEQQGLFQREISQIEIIDIDDIEKEKKGMIQRICRLSTVHIKTHGKYDYNLKISDLAKADKFELLLEAVQDIHTKASLGSKHKVKLNKEILNKGDESRTE